MHKEVRLCCRTSLKKCGLVNGSIKFSLQAFEQHCTLQREGTLGLSQAVLALNLQNSTKTRGSNLSISLDWIASVLELKGSWTPGK